MLTTLLEVILHLIMSEDKPKMSDAEMREKSQEHTRKAVEEFENKLRREREMWEKNPRGTFNAFR